MCHGVNAALEKIVSTGIPFSASVMFACPWYQEGVEILKRAPHVS
ncbi:MAG: ChbG/HpnK family deacetylase, partial [Bacteroidota bacterium]